ncbi:hypothetical protein DFS34DRAFT_615263 [Phlyctochytrium arcticum]|nr:hypothetical protein DFS34DRAFT_615263 [Phlyctochytrium arcticum]
MPDEIGISVGDECEIYKRFHDGWIHGRNRSTNKIGIFPGGCLTCLTPPGGLPPFMSSALRQDSMMSMKSFVSSSSQWMYGPPTESPPEKSETGSYTIEIEEDAPKPTARRRRQQRAQILKKAAIMVTAMIIALTLVLGLGVVLGGHIFEKQHPSLWAHVSV